MRGMRWANLVLALLAVLAPMAHVLEMANKLALDGPLWLAVQQHLYRGWGPFWGAPVEIGALATSAMLLAHRRADPGLRRLSVLAVAAYAAMIGVFAALNAPVNAALSGWTAATLPADWSDWRLRWETGHAVAAALAVLGLAVCLRAANREAVLVRA